MKPVTGLVISAKTEKTIVVLVERLFQAPLYKKVVKKRKKFHAHDELGAKEGERVVLVETRPLSKLKRWRVIKIIGREVKPKKEAKKTSGAAKKATKEAVVVVKGPKKSGQSKKTAKKAVKKEVKK